MMRVVGTDIPDVKLLSPKKFGDPRGFFSEVYNWKAWSDAGIETVFVQDNHSLSAERGVVRGLHYQIPPMAQDKLVRVVRGAILDVAVDIRPGSATFGKHVSAVLSESNWQQIFVPRGFAHGFVTLDPNTEVVYKVSDYYSPGHERGICWDDPDLGIDWGIDPARAVLSDRDQRLPSWVAAIQSIQLQGAGE